MKKRLLGFLIAATLILSIFLYGCAGEQEFAGEAFMKLDASKRAGFKQCVDDTCQLLNKQTTEYKECVQECIDISRGEGYQKTAGEVSAEESEVESGTESATGCCVGPVGCSRAFYDSECSNLTSFDTRKCEDITDCDIVACCHDIPGLPSAMYRVTCADVADASKVPTLSSFSSDFLSVTEKANILCHKPVSGDEECYFIHDAMSEREHKTYKLSRINQDSISYSVNPVLIQTSELKDRATILRVYPTDNKLDFDIYDPFIPTSMAPALKEGEETLLENDILLKVVSITDNSQDGTSRVEFCMGFGNCVRAGECDQGTMVTQTCTDSDGGLDYNTKGYTTIEAGGESHNTYDSCAIIDGQHSNILDEQICNGYYTTFRGYECPGDCQNGACVDINTTESICTDSDYGIQFYFYGTTTGYLTTQRTTIGTLNDICVPSYGSREEVLEGPYIYEKSCDVDVISHSWYQCPNGCRSGVCTKPGQQESAETTPYIPPAPQSQEEICNNGIDDDGDGYPDCFDGDCEEECPALFELGTVCCLYHSQKTCQYEPDFETGMCEGMGKYPVISESVCRVGCAEFNYEYIS